MAELYKRNSGSRVLVTGGNGFIGSALLTRLRHDGVAAVGAVRSATPCADCVQGPPLDSDGNWRNLLAGCRVVVHAAGRVHVMQESSNDPIQAFRVPNVDGTLNLARQAAWAGVQRFVFISSIKVNGEVTVPGRPFTAEDALFPQDAYAISKADAETALKTLAAETGMEVVVIRPPLIYGPAVRANFLALMRLVRAGVPLPLGAIKHNRRTLAARDNVVDLIVTCIEHPSAANQVFLAGDGEDLSTAELLRRLATAMGVSARLVPVPEWVLRAGAYFVGQENVFQRLCGNLQVDISKAKELLGWVPPISVDEGLRRTVEGFRA